MRLKTSAAAMLIAAVCSAQAAQSPSQTHKRQFQFEQFPAELYKGPIHMPPGLHKDEEGDWRDELGKWATSPEVTFAGEYYLAVHDCGTFCRYYELFNLRTGGENSQVNQFGTGEDPPKTQDGHIYLTILYSRPDSRLLIAEYHLDFYDPPPQEDCRQEYFVLENGRLRAISRIFHFCTEEHSARQ